jgi:hypothetical protein
MSGLPSVFRDSVKGPDVVHQGDRGERVAGGVDSGERVDYLLFRDGVLGPDVVLQGDSSRRVDGGGDSGE